jgi:hypothetical protein
MHRPKWGAKDSIAFFREKAVWITGLEQAEEKKIQDISESASWFWNPDGSKLTVLDGNEVFKYELESLEIESSLKTDTKDPFGFRRTYSANGDAYW